MRGKAFALGTAVVLAISFASYVSFPEACEFSFTMKLIHTFSRLVENLSELAEYFGGNYIKVFRFFMRGSRVQGIEVTNEMFGGVSTTIFKAKGLHSEELTSAIVYYHGGGWSCGSAEIYGKFMKTLAVETGMTIVFPEYRLAPEHPYPIPLQDCVDATINFVENAKKFNVDPKKIILAGDSAGGNLAAAVSLRVAKRAGSAWKPCAMYLLYPALQMGNFMLPSYQQNFDPPLLPPKMMARFFLYYMGMQNETGLIDLMLANLHVEGLESEAFVRQVSEKVIPNKYERRGVKPKNFKPTKRDYDTIRKYKSKFQLHASDPEFAPLSATDEEVKLLPKTFILTCEYDVLRDDGIILHERMKSLEMEVIHKNLEFGTHGILMFHGLTDHAKLNGAVFDLISRIKMTSSEC